MKNKAKINWFDRTLGFFSPSALNVRLLERQKTEVLTRQYDAAQPVNYNSSKKSANKEIKNALSPIRENVRTLLRNAPFAKKALSTIVNSSIGWGIEANIKHADADKQKQINELFNEWKRNCSFSGVDFYSLQSNVMSSVVSDGEALLKVVVKDGSVRLLQIEADYIATNVCKLDNIDENHTISNGIVLDQNSVAVAYVLYKKHPTVSNEVEVVPASEVIHTFRRERPEQNRGVSWFANVYLAIKNLDELQYTMLMRQKLSASLTAVVTSEPSQIPDSQLQNQRDEFFELNAGSVRYINPGDKIEFPSIPNADGFPEATKLVLREISAGLGITYESLSNDLSNVNWSSYRAGDIHFRANIENWRWQMFIPLFLDVAFEKAFKKFCGLKGVDLSGVTIEWIPPQRQMANPAEEIAATKDAIRNGLLTLPQALKELGYDPEVQLQEIKKSNDKLDELGIILDSDPRRIGNQQLQSAENLKSITSPKNEE